MYKHNLGTNTCFHAIFQIHTYLILFDTLRMQWQKCSDELAQPTRTCKIDNRVEGGGGGVNISRFNLGLVALTTQWRFTEMAFFVNNCLGSQNHHNNRTKNKQPFAKWLLLLIFLLKEGL
jgi:hypothetical protein